jgi:hypothetical protein
MNGARWNLRMRPARRICFVVHAIVFFSLALATAPRLQGQTAGGAGAQVVAPGRQVSASGAEAGLPANWSEGVKALAGKIAGAVKPSRAISFEVRNTSSLSAAEVEAIRKALASELAVRGVRVGSGEVEVGVTLSENVGGYVWVAQISKDESTRVELIQVTKATALSTSLTPTPILQRRIVWRDKNQFLDFEAHDSFLGAFEVSRRTLWSETGIHSYALGLDKQFRDDNDRLILIPKFPRPRDVRGLLADRKGENRRGYFGYAACIESQPVYCAENSSQDWPIGYGAEARFVGNRNYFDGISFEPEKKWPQFFSVAVNKWATDGAMPWIQAELDGKSRLYEYASEPEATFSGWGDDIASIDLPCGMGWQVLVSGTGDWTVPDHLQIYKIADHNFAQTAGEPLSFPGPILALWSSEDGKSARVVSKNLETGMYEASIVTVSCSE